MKAISWLSGIAVFAVAGFLAYRFPASWSGSTDARDPMMVSYNARVDALSQVDESLILYRETDALAPSGLDALRAIAVDPEDRLYAGGGRYLVIYTPAGEKIRRMILPGDITALAVDSRQILYVGLGNAVRAYAADGQLAAIFDGIAEDAILTSIVADEENVFVADAQNRKVMRFTPAGEFIQVIDGKQGDPSSPGFVVPSPYFDLALGQGRTLWIVNPGRHRLEEYNFDGQRIHAWDRAAGTGVEYFCGCCNPTHLARLRDGSLVTSEKGISRVKVYTPRGGFTGVVAAPKDFDGNTLSLDLAVDSRDRVLVADSARLQIRFFELIDP